MFLAQNLTWVISLCVLIKLIGLKPLRTNFTKKFMNERKVTWVDLGQLALYSQAGLSRTTHSI